METLKVPQIENLTKITPEQAADYVRFVAELRLQQRRFFTYRKPEILKECKRMEFELDTLNSYLLDPVARLF